MNNIFAVHGPDFSDGNCARTPLPDLFFPDSIAATINIAPLIARTCGPCVRREECLQFAVTNHEEWGIWGGLTPEQREVISPFRTKKLDTQAAFNKLMKLGLTEEQAAHELGVQLDSIKRQKFKHARKARLQNTTQQDTTQQGTGARQ